MLEIEALKGFFHEFVSFNSSRGLVVLRKFLSDFFAPGCLRGKSDFQLKNNLPGGQEMMFSQFAKLVSGLSNPPYVSHSFNFSL